MPASKKIASYPFELQQLADRFITNQAPLYLPFPDKKRAQTFRFKLYGFKGAIEAESIGSANPLTERWANFMAANLRLEGTTVIVSMPEDAEDMKILRSAMQHTPSDPFVTAGETSDPLATDAAVARVGENNGGDYDMRDATYQTPGAPAAPDLEAPAPADDTSAVEDAVESFMQDSDGKPK